MSFKCKLCTGLFVAALALVATLLMGFTSTDNGGAQAAMAATALTAATAATASKNSAVEQVEHVQTYVYWPVWRSGN